ncbi:MAG: GNAT family N-acetyltransferase [archaeon]|nr:GNAT family N-acetyltransferase [archaeon]
MVVHILDKTTEGEYSKYVQEHPQATFEHLLIWRNSINIHFGFVPYYLIKKNKEGVVEGILPLFKAKGLFGTRFVSVPYAVSAGILSNSIETTQELVSFAKELAKKEKVDYLEIREQTELKQTTPPSYGKKVFSFSLLLSPNTDEVWKKLPKGSIRWGIKKAQRSELTFEFGNNDKLFNEFYPLFLNTRKHRGVPAYPASYLKTILNRFGDNARIYIARYNQKPVAAIFLLYYKTEMRYAFAGSATDRNILQMQPYHLLMWDAIYDACNRGYTTFNLGGAMATTNGGGLYEFKKKWADKIVETPSYFYFKEGKSLPHDDTLFIKFASACWKKMPITLVRKLSPVVIRQFV